MKQDVQLIMTPADAAALFRTALPKVQREERVFVLPLDGSGKVLAKPILVSVGSEDGTATIDPGAIFREALRAGAEEIIVAHNHPSGDLRPSKADVSATKKLQEAAQLLGVTLLDHLIVGSSDSPDGTNFTSLAEMLQGETK
jgi:DNA repair protein RadC